MKFNKEIWKPVRGFPGYFVSNRGRIKGKKVNILKPKEYTPGDYLWYDLYKNGKRHRLSGHRIVALNFIRRPRKDLEVNHKDGIKGKNRKDNLEWVTHKYNVRHAIKNGLCNFPKGKEHHRYGKSTSDLQKQKARNRMNSDKNPSKKLKPEEVWLIKRILNKTKTKPYFIGKMFKVNKRTIQDIEEGVSWKRI